MFNFSNETRSFIWISLIAFISVMTAHYLTQEMNKVDLYYLYADNTTSFPIKRIKNTNKPEVDLNRVVDDTDWVEYSDPKFDINFTHPVGWDVKAFQEISDEGMYILSLNAFNRTDIIKIYISQDGYYAMDGLPKEVTTLGGKKIVNVADMLIGVEHNKTFYTFDLNGNIEFQPEFRKLVENTTFKK